MTEDTERDLLQAELKKLARRHPDGVDRALLKSWFLCALAHQRSEAGEPKLLPLEFTAKFEEALAALMAQGKARHPPRVSAAGQPASASDAPL